MERIINYSEKIRKVGNLTADKEIVFPENVNVVINDLNLNSEEKDILCGLSAKKIAFLEPDIYSKELIQLIPESLLKDPSTSIIYPKRGGLIVRKSINLERVSQYSIQAKRDGVNSTPYVNIPKQMLANLSNGDTKNILILDDVIVTGSTLDAIRSKVYELTDIVDYSDYNQSLRFAPTTTTTKRLPIKWYAGALMINARPNDQENNLNNFEKIFTPIYYKGQNGQTPVNSISTWVFDKEKGDLVLSRYAEKYSTNPEKFYLFIKSLKRR